MLISRLTPKSQESCCLSEAARYTLPLGLALFVLCSLTRSLGATTYYTDKARGSDGNDGRSTGAAFATINKGASVLVAGDTLFVRAGTYNEAIFNNVPSGNSWAVKVRIAAYPGETVWMTPLVDGVGNNGRVIFFGGAAGVSPRYIEFDGINLDHTHLSSIAIYFDTFEGANPNHIRIQNAEVIEAATGGAGAILIASHDNQFINLKVHGGGADGGPTCGPTCASYAFYIAGDNNLIEGCDMYDTSGAGVHIYSGSRAPTNNIVRNNRIHDITRAGSLSQVWGILVSGNNNYIYNNLIYNIRTSLATASNAGVNIFSGSGNKIWNNTIYNNTNSGIFIGSDASVSSVEVKNNIAYANSGSAFVDEGGKAISSTNLFGVDPKFVNSAGGDLRLLSNSPAIDAGVSLAPMFTTDFAGTTRPQGSAYDIGAYEYTAGGSGSPVVTLSPGAVSFGPVAVGATSAVQYVTISNTGNATLNFSDIVFSGDFAPAGLGTCGVTSPVTSGNSCTISIVFSPGASGPRAGSITLTDNASPSTQIITLSGTGGGSSACDVNRDGSPDVSDVQLAINQVMATPPCVPFGQSGSADINQDGQCTVVDVQRVVNAALGGACVSP